MENSFLQTLYYNQIIEKLNKTGSNGYLLYFQESINQILIWRENIYEIYYLKKILLSNCQDFRSYIHIYNQNS